MERGRVIRDMALPPLPAGTGAPMAPSPEGYGSRAANACTLFWQLLYLKWELRSVSAPYLLGTKVRDPGTGWEVEKVKPQRDLILFQQYRLKLCYFVHQNYCSLTSCLLSLHDPPDGKIV